MSTPAPTPCHRFVTVESYSGVIVAYTENELYQQAIDDGETAEWIWQFAKDKATAIAQHYDKHDKWAADMNAGREEQVTY